MKLTFTQFMEDSVLHSGVIRVRDYQCEVLWDKATDKVMFFLSDKSNLGCYTGNFNQDERTIMFDNKPPTTDHWYVLDGICAAAEDAIIERLQAESPLLQYPPTPLTIDYEEGPWDL